jgi:hypothetical protein
MPTKNEISSDERATLVPFLQRLADNPSIIQDDEQIKALIAKIHRTGKKGERRGNVQKRHDEDDGLRRSTAMAQRDLQQKPVAMVSGEDTPVAGEFHRPVHCYRCKRAFTTVHFFYHQLCPDCATLCYAKRDQETDLSGRIALITGGRLKIGYQLALRMLRDGARVIVTTRFPEDARQRFNSEKDADEWRERLAIHGLDLRHLPSLEAFVWHLSDTEPHLDILINHAAQTVKRPLEFYAHLLAAEAAALPLGAPPTLLEARREYAGSMAPLLAQAADSLFPANEQDAYGQQVDRRPNNSWSLTLEEINALRDAGGAVGQLHRAVSALRSAKTAPSALPTDPAFYYQRFRIRGAVRAA